MPVVRLPSRVLPLDQRRLHLGAHVGRGFRTEAYRGELEGRLGVCPAVGTAVAIYPRGGLLTEVVASDAAALLRRAHEENV